MAPRESSRQRSRGPGTTALPASARWRTGREDDAEGTTLAAVPPCLERIAETTPVRGGVAEGASEAVRLRLPSSAVTVLVAADADAASDLALDYGVVRGDRSQVANVVLAWEAVPNPGDALAVEERIT